MNHSTLTLGELLTMSDEIIKRNAMSILKRLQVLQPEHKHDKNCYMECMHKEFNRK